VESASLPKGTVAAAIAHPTRVQILITATDHVISPARYVEEVMGVDSAKQPAEYKRALSHASYHFRELENLGCIEQVGTEPVRGAIQHFYRAVERAHLSDEEWASLGEKERCNVLTVVWRELVMRTEAARLSHTLLKDDTWLAWTDAKLDPQGWAEVGEANAAHFANLERIRVESEARPPEDGAEPIRSTFAVIGFQSADDVD
jgi:hypothetical protein